MTSVLHRKKHSFKTTHGPGRGKHIGIMDGGVWTTPNCATEIDLVRELKRLGFHIKNYECTHTQCIGPDSSDGQITHTWYRSI